MESKRLRTLKLVFFLVLAIFAGSNQNALAQTDKQINKAIKVFFAKGYSEGIDKLWKYMHKEDYPTLSAYETWVEMEYLLYLQMDEVYGGIEITVENIEDEDTTSSDSLTKQLLLDFKGIPKQKFINVCRLSTNESFSFTADAYLAKFLVDFDPDSARVEKAKDYFDEGDEFLEKEDYELAELNYRKALNEDPGYYKACLKLGITFWAREDFDSAMVYFTEAKEMHPELIEPRKYIIDGLIEQGLLYRAKKECMEALCIYSGFDVKRRLNIILEVENKYMENHRFRRYWFANDIKEDDQNELPGFWNTYRLAKDNISKYCNEDGIIEPNGDTEDGYLEVYSFRKMLTQHESELPNFLKFGFKMMEEDYLEPYIFISLFHVDIYPQFKHYMSFEENRAKSIEYVEKYCIETYPDE